MYVKITIFETQQESNCDLFTEKLNALLPLFYSETSFIYLTVSVITLK